MKNKCASSVFLPRWPWSSGSCKSRKNTVWLVEIFLLPDPLKICVKSHEGSEVIIVVFGTTWGDRSPYSSEILRIWSTNQNIFYC